MKNSKKLFSAILAMVVGAWLMPQTVLSQQGQAGAPVEENPAFDGEWQYNTYCATCHGFEGEGFYPFGVPLANNPFIMNSPPELIIRVIQEGRYDDVVYPAYSGMPPFHHIRAAQARALVAYMQGALQE